MSRESLGQAPMVIANRYRRIVADLQNELKHRNVVAVVGAGISAATAPREPATTWRGLLHSGAEYAHDLVRDLTPGWLERVREDIDSGDIDSLLSAAEKVSKRLQGEGGEYGRWLREAIGSLRPSSRTAVEALAALDVPILTTNYDSLIEQVTGFRGITWQQAPDVEYWIRGQERTILHLHGHWQYPESVILGIRDYSRILGDSHTQAILQALRTTKTLLFVGFGAGLDDPNFSALLTWARAAFSKAEFRHYRIVRDAELETVHKAHPPSDRIFAIPYGADFSDLPPFLEALRLPTAGTPALRQPQTGDALLGPSDSLTPAAAPLARSTSSQPEGGVFEHYAQVQAEPTFSEVDAHKPTPHQANVADAAISSVDSVKLEDHETPEPSDDVPVAAQHPQTHSVVDEHSESKSERTLLPLSASQHALAKSLVKAVVAQGSAESAYTLGTMFELGLTVSADSDRALLFYEKATLLGSADAMNSLALLCEMGEITERNMEVAWTLYSRAAELGSESALKNLRRIGLKPID